MSGRIAVTLSGIVGAGKSTAAKEIVRSLRSAGCPAEHVRFQDFVALRARPRSSGGAPGAGPANEGAPRHNEGRARWDGYRRRRLTARIAVGHLLRTLLYRVRLLRWPRETVLVFDRYFYDSLVHYDVSAGGAWLRLLIGAIPAPTVAGLLLIGEATVLERRADYSREYARSVVEGYERLPAHFPNLLVVRSDDFDLVGQLSNRIVATVLQRTGQGFSG